jgi:hypothetical protein
LGRIFFAEHVQRPVVDCGASKMRVVEAASKVSLEHNWFDPRCPLFRPTQSPAVGNMGLASFSGTAHAQHPFDARDPPFDGPQLIKPPAPNEAWLIKDTLQQRARFRRRRQSRDIAPEANQDLGCHSLAPIVPSTSSCQAKINLTDSLQSRAVGIWYKWTGAFTGPIICFTDDIADLRN